MKHLSMTPELYDYMLDISLKEHPVLKTLREDTARLPLAAMQIAPEQAQFMQLLLRLLQARYVLELGTFTGYSSLAMALALPEEGKVITCDHNTDWTSTAQLFWKQAKQDKKIELRMGTALNSMNQLIKEGWENKFDFIFIDADKSNYCQYYEMALKLVKPKGLIAIDNIFWNAKVIDEHESGGQTQEIRNLNNLIKEDKRVFSSLLPIADGLFLIQLL